MSPAGVDLELWAHEHTYERLWPVYGDKVGLLLRHADSVRTSGVTGGVFSFQVCNGSTEQPYVKPRAPVHIITGSAVSLPVSAVSFALTGQRAR